jgi:anti-sigma regulatory factor (Ser/Thr protein kinase)
MAFVALPHAPESAAAARHHLAAGLTALGVELDVIADAELVFTEMVGNAVRHARPLPDGRLRAGWEIRNDLVVLRVCDGGAPTRPVVRCRHDVVDAERGRGLAIVAALARDWGAQQEGRGLRTWATIDLVRM